MNRNPAIEPTNFEEVEVANLDLDDLDFDVDHPNPDNSLGGGDTTSSYDDDSTTLLTNVLSMMKNKRKCITVSAIAILFGAITLSSWIYQRPIALVFSPLMLTSLSLCQMFRTNNCAHTLLKEVRLLRLRAARMWYLLICPPVVITLIASLLAFSTLNLVLSRCLKMRAAME